MRAVRDTKDAPRDLPSALRRGAISCVTLLLATLALAACAQKMVYLLVDGRAPASDPVLNRQFEADRALCNEEMSRSVQGGDHGDGSSTRGREVMQVGDECMAEKGYVTVPQDQVAAKQKELAANAAAPTRN